MLVYDLHQYQCPQQFIQFKLALKHALATSQSVIFKFNTHKNQDIEKFLTKQKLSFAVDHQQGYIIVESQSV